MLREGNGMSDEGYIRKVEALITRANHRETPEAERQACLEKADAIMAAHRLERAMLFQSGGKPEREIILKKYEGIQVEGFYGNVVSLRESIFRHCGAMTNGYGTMTAVGYEEDLFYAEMLWGEVFLHFTRTMFPKWEAWRSFDANVYELKTAGYSWPEIREMGLREKAADVTGLLTEKNAGSKLRTAYKREAVRRGEPAELPKVYNPKKWRKSFADAYGSRLSFRLWRMKKEQKQEAGEAGVIALQTDEDRVKLRFWQEFPHMHPDAIRQMRQQLDEEEKARRDALTDKEREKEDRERERSRARARKAAESGISYYDDRGYEAGQKAANQVRLDRNDSVGQGERQAIE